MRILGALQTLEEYLARSGKINGPPVIAYYDIDSGNIVFNLNENEVKGILYARFGSAEDVWNFITEHETLHRRNPTYSENQILTIQTENINNIVARGLGRLPNPSRAPAATFNNKTVASKR